jgi:hypothetical protein
LRAGKEERVIRNLLHNRNEASLVTSLFLGCALLLALPFPADDPLLSLIRAERQWVFSFLRTAYNLLLFTTPFLIAKAVLSTVYVLTPAARKKNTRVQPPPFPEARETLQLVIGEVHNERTPEPSERPRWLVIPEKGLFTGIAIFGGIGSGKTTGCMYPFAEQIFSYGKSEEKIGGLVLEVKGDFCFRVKEILERHGRGDDYVEINLSGSRYRYNPIHNDLDAYAIAYGIATLLNSLFGKGREPFWQQAYTNMVKFIILLHRVLYDYVTLLDVYECAINPDLLLSRIKLAEEAMKPYSVITVEAAVYMEHEGLSEFKWETKDGCMEALLTDELSKLLAEESIPHQLREADVLPSGMKPIRDELKREQFQAVERWFHNDWMRIEQRLRTSIVEGISFFLSLFDDNPILKRVFCPPKECYDPVLNADGHLGIPLTPFSELIEQGKVVAVNFPTSANPGLSRMIGTLMKVDFQRAVLGRVQLMERTPDKYFRQVLFLCDEYHAFATVGESDPTGDEKFFSLSRQSRCIPIVSTQSISSIRSTTSGEGWRTLLQTFRTKIFLAAADDFTAKVASDLCGRDEHLKLSYSLTENGQDAQVSMLSGRSTASRASVSTSKNYSIQRDNVFEAKVFYELRNAKAIVLAYDGLNPLPATYCYLKPYFLDKNVSYFEHVKRGVL